MPRVYMEFIKYPKHFPIYEFQIYFKADSEVH
jgi:hypothetical protein